MAAFFLSLHSRELYRYYTMQKVIIIVEQSSDGAFGCRTETDIAGVGLNACGKDAASAKADLLECYEEAKAAMKAEGKEMPEVEFVF